MRGWGEAPGEECRWVRALVSSEDKHSGSSGFGPSGYAWEYEECSMAVHGGCDPVEHVPTEVMQKITGDLVTEDYLLTILILSCSCATCTFLAVGSHFLPCSQGPEPCWDHGILDRCIMEQ
ncbi:hypothetical protein P7K49_039290 [Saguinus oedipus]|uniref:Uncharacterized protein n=1 Tax=Saguinus oedipus TaxID=9490 RepID=A0ABQ9TH42_SAGOE|nr:hypothetical protein P7K49_039290 [Saguinus oedipus]